MWMGLRWTTVALACLCQLWASLLCGLRRGAYIWVSLVPSSPSHLEDGSHLRAVGRALQSTWKDIQRHSINSAVIAYFGGSGGEWATPHIALVRVAEREKEIQSITAQGNDRQKGCMSVYKACLEDQTCRRWAAENVLKQEWKHRCFFQLFQLTQSTIYDPISAFFFPWGNRGSEHWKWLAQGHKSVHWAQEDYNWIFWLAHCPQGGLQGTLSARILSCRHGDAMSNIKTVEWHAGSVQFGRLIR